MPKWRSRGEGGGATTTTTDYPFSGSVEGGGTIEGTIHLPSTTPPPEPQPPEPEPPPDGGGNMPAYSYTQQYADTEAATPPGFKRIIQPNANSQWGSGLTIAPGPYPPGYRIANGQEGGGFPPSGQVSNGSLPIRLQPPSSGNGVKFQFVTQFNCTVVNEGSQDGKFLIALGVIYPSEKDRPMMPYLGCFHCINDYRLMVPWTIKAGQAMPVTVFRLDVLDPDFADIPGWPQWKVTPNTNGLYPAVGPTYWNGGPGPLNVKDIMALGYTVSY
jgi:hypothetical protein